MMEILQKLTLSNLKFTIIVFLLPCLFACNPNPSKPATDLKIDSLVNQAKDSLFHNNTFSKLQFKAALSLTRDSSSFYKVLSDYTTYYFTVNAYDTAYLMTRRLMKYANRQPLTPRVHDLLTSANNFMGNYYTAQNKFDSAIYYYKIAFQHGYMKTDRST